MPWLFGPMKDVAVSDKRRGGDEQPLIRRSPNGETQVEQSTYSVMKISYTLDTRIDAGKKILISKSLPADRQANF
jgi:hypothetical protein